MYEQIESGLTPERVWLRLLAAREVRHEACAALFTPRAAGAKLALDLERVRQTLESEGGGRHWMTRQHPAEPYLWKEGPADGLVLEAAFQMMCLEELAARQDEAVAHVLFYNQLVYAQIIKLTVHQADQRGFDQFQKITVDEARSLSEAAFQRRFHQLDVTEQGDILFLEGRFAPGKTRAQTRVRSGKINKGYTAFTADYKKQNDRESRMTYGLVCHFIKKPPGKPFGCRHHTLRSSLMREGHALAAAFDVTKPNPSPLLIGIDAAANELHTPPEVFAPVFRYLRQHGAKNFTYHAGEDFVHLLSGIRTVHETILFLGMRPGNRIGHAVAIGIHPEFWRARIGERVVMKQGDHLDDLVFAYSRLMVQGDHVGAAARLLDRIENYSREIYGDAYSPQVLHRAWLLRSIDPFILLYSKEPGAMLDERQRIAVEAAMEELERFPEATPLYLHYHGLWEQPLAEVMDKWNKLISVDTYVVPPEAMWCLQEMQLKELVDQRIAIETLPTSNVRIGFYKDHSQHHLFRWLGLWPQSGVQPIVVLGSDDPGIFATSLRAEHFHIYRVLTAQYGLTSDAAFEVLRKLRRNADAFRFTTEHNIRVS